MRSGTTKVEDTKLVTGIRKRQHNGQTKKDKQRSTKQYTEHQRSSNPNPPNREGGEFRCASEGLGVYCSTCVTGRVTLVINLMMS